MVEPSFIVKTPRDVVEVRLMEHCSPHIRPLENTYSYLLRTWRGAPAGAANVLSVSSNFPRGLMYKEHDVVFGVEVVVEEVGLPVIYIVAPHGAGWGEAVDKFTTAVLEMMPEADISIRYPMPGHPPGALGHAEHSLRAQKA